jgi:hypothetical protein
MYRRLATLGFVALTLCLCPSPANAYFWEWLDSLSGPRFGGVLYEWRVWCGSQKGPDVLGRFRENLQADIDKYKRATGPADAEPFFKNAVKAAETAQRFVKAAIDALEETPQNDADAHVLTALTLRRMGSELFSLGRRAPSAFATSRLEISIKALAGYESKPIEVRPRSFGGGGIGVAVSLCSAKPYERSTKFLQVNVGVGFERKGVAPLATLGATPGALDFAQDDNTRPLDDTGDHNRLVTFGASYHAVIKPYLTVGVGAGLASFSSARVDGFNKLYVEPYIIDIKPLATWGDPAYRTVWRHIFYFRYSTLTFPAGFEPGRFSGRSQRYPAELLHSVGFHADLEPVIRKLQGTWR